MDIEGSGQVRGGKLWAKGIGKEYVKKLLCFAAVPLPLGSLQIFQLQWRAQKGESLSKITQPTCFLGSANGEYCVAACAGSQDSVLVALPSF